MPKLDEQISTLQQKLLQLKLRQQRVDARKQAVIGRRERKADTRRKILLGGLILEKLRQGELDRQLVTTWLERGLTRAADRALFDLPAPVPAVVGTAPVNPATSGNRVSGEFEAAPGIEDDDGHGVG